MKSSEHQILELELPTLLEELLVKIYNKSDINNCQLLAKSCILAGLLNPGEVENLLIEEY